VEYGNGLQLGLLHKFWNVLSGPILEKCISLYAPIEDLTREKAYLKCADLKSQGELMERLSAAPGALEYLTIGIIVGIPQHSREDLFIKLPRNLEKLLQVFSESPLKVAATIFNFMPRPGTSFGEEAMRSGRMVADPRLHPELVSFGTPSYIPPGLTALEVWDIYKKLCDMNPAGRSFGTSYSRLFMRGAGAVPLNFRDKIPKEWKRPGLHYREKVAKIKA
jgi:hypothetical protein